MSYIAVMSKMRVSGLRAGFAAKGVGLVVLNWGTCVQFKSEGESEGGRERDRVGQGFLRKPKL